MDRNRLKGFMPILLFFLALNAFFITGKRLLQKWEMDQDVVMAGNAILFVITLISFLLSLRGLNNPNPHAFIRAVYLSVMLKLFVCMIAAFIYISIHKAGLNKPALFTSMGLYLVYTFMEVGVLMKMLKQKKNA